MSAHETEQSICSQCTDAAPCDVWRDYVLKLRTNIASAIDENDKAYTVAKARLVPLLKEKNKEQRKYETAEENKRFAKWITLGCGSAFLGFAGLSIYNLWNAKK